LARRFSQIQEAIAELDNDFKLFNQLGGLIGEGAENAEIHTRPVQILELLQDLLGNQSDDWRKSIKDTTLYEFSDTLTQSELCYEINILLNKSKSFLSALSLFENLKHQCTLLSR